MYFYYIKVLQILYSIYHKPNGVIDVFKMKHKKNYNLFYYVLCRKPSYLKMELWANVFFGLIYHDCHHIK